MTFRQTDGPSVIQHLQTLSDEVGCGWLRQVGTLCGWGPATEWEEGFMAEKGTVRTLLDVVIARTTPSFFNVLVGLAPPESYRAEWKAALGRSRVHYEWLDNGGAGFFVPENSIEAQELAWHSFDAWAVPRVADIQRRIYPTTIHRNQWSKQILLSAEAAFEVVREGGAWEAHWEALRQLAPILDVTWPGPMGDWRVGDDRGAFLPIGVHAWDAVALAADNPAILEKTWFEGCGHELAKPMTPTASLSNQDQRTLGQVLSRALRPRQLGSPKVAKWLMEQTPVLDVQAIHPGLPSEPIKTWREVLPLSSDMA